MVGYDTPPSVLMLPAELSEKGRCNKNSKNFSKIAGTRFTLDERHRTRGEGRGGEFDALRLLINPFGVLYALAVPGLPGFFELF